MTRRLQKSLAPWLVLCLVLSACSKDKDVEPPAQLVPLHNKIKIKELWSTRLDSKKTERLRLALRPASDGSRLYAAAHNGYVYAFNPDTAVPSGGCAPSCL